MSRNNITWKIQSVRGLQQRAISVLFLQTDAASDAGSSRSSRKGPISRAIGSALRLLRDTATDLKPAGAEASAKPLAR